eukprot:CAMPEP_0184312814 /NCGR_PEP_ID=MMETSP1049-20130417/54595_1 /TAXON_ID=77928 /ORGANISM="Proteomonas sulcata, Strain CCMP704" /LENGTH=48 /DNA_ID= /DNA_START= /DNA_END= /DNA_ORIENTATION=
MPVSDNGDSQSLTTSPGMWGGQAAEESAHRPLRVRGFSPSAPRPLGPS